MLRVLRSVLRAGGGFPRFFGRERETGGEDEPGHQENERDEGVEVTEILNDVGLKIPSDCAFMMYSHSSPGIAGIDQRMDIVGETATELLTGMILHTEPSAHGVLRTMDVLGSIMPGATLPQKGETNKLQINCESQ